MYTYRLYDVENVFRKQIDANSYTEAKQLLKPQSNDKIFSVEEDGHEVECGMAWVRDLLDHGDE